MILGKFTKQPADVFDYDIDFSQWLPTTPTPDTVASAVAVVDDASLTLGATVISATGVKQWVSGGTDGKTYKITLTATTNGGRVIQEEFKIKVKDF
jgi:hypothetical protein